MVKIPNGYIFFARKIKQSDIWLKKPSWWLKVWGYILMEVNHAKNKEFPRGQNFFTREQIYYNCKLNLDKIKVETVDNVIRWLRATTQITTRKTTRGIIITVCNYNAYQDSKNYKDETVDEIVDETKTRQKRDKNDTINKNDKNVKKELSSIQKIVEHYKKIKEYDTIDNWDKEHFARATASAKRILSQADDETQACKAITEIGKHHDNERLSWTIETVVKKFPDWKLGKLKPSKPQQQKEDKYIPPYLKNQIGVKV